MCGMRDFIYDRVNEKCPYELELLEDKKFFDMMNKAELLCKSVEKNSDYSEMAFNWISNLILHLSRSKEYPISESHISNLVDYLHKILDYSPCLDYSRLNLDRNVDRIRSFDHA